MSRLPPPRIAVPALLVLLALLTGGWRLLEFLTDDAYIAFRYASNSLRGWGLTWNPPPFEPVEGYTSFLWVVLLREVWRFTGWLPPDASNVFGLLCGYGILALCLAWLRRLELPPAVAPGRWLLAFVALVGLVTNRTFLTWLSSGLETPLVNLLWVWWLFELTSPPRRRGRLWGARLSTAAALSALTRPDGLLQVAATGALALWRLAPGSTERRSAVVAGSAPLLLVPIHLLWRRWTYGFWLPNTYYAKVSTPWPEAGWRYLGSFLVENGLWLWLLAAAAWGVAEILRRRGGDGYGGLPLWLATATVLGHVGYYTVRVGGDHFEYRVFSYLIPICFVTAMPLVARWTRRPAAALGLLVLLVLVSWPIPWVHWHLTHNLTTRAETRRLHQPLAEHFPAPLRPAVAAFDDWQLWMSQRLVGSRHQEHKVFHDFHRSVFPTRREGSRYRWDDGGWVIRLQSVGVPGWTLPEVAVIDLLGLNDRVIARSPESRPGVQGRSMAHDRLEPPGYSGCFRPNLIARRDRFRELARGRPLLDEDIIACEQQFLRLVTAGAGSD